MKIKKNDILTVDKYMYEALYNRRSGYYMKGNPFGKSGDYITAPNISILFSEMIAIWIILFWENLKRPKKFNLIELGAGNGEMIKQIIKTFDKFLSFKNSCKINILEKSIYLKKIQKQKLKNKKIKWLKNLNEVSNIPSIFIGNEFFDALPIKQFFKINKKWMERFVVIQKNNKKKFIDFNYNIKKIEKKIGFKISKNQKTIEYSPLGLEYLKIISKIINNKKGGLLIIDYGYLENSMKDTLMAIKKHNNSNVLKAFGNSDITHKLNFNILKKIAKNLKLKCQGITTQKTFLTNLGINQRAEIISKDLPFSKKADIYYRLNRLIDKNQMGDLFKVMLLTSHKINFKVGFEIA